MLTDLKNEGILELFYSLINESLIIEFASYSVPWYHQIKTDKSVFANNIRSKMPEMESIVAT